MRLKIGSESERTLAMRTNALALLVMWAPSPGTAHSARPATSINAVALRSIAADDPSANHQAMIYAQ